MTCEVCSIVELMFAYIKPFDRVYAPQSPLLASAMRECYQIAGVPCGSFIVT